jgi:hypothetical protein
MDRIVQECIRILGAARDAGILLRAIGGVAVGIHSPEAASLPSLRREYGDIDFVTVSKYSSLLRGFFESIGYLADRRFNALHGRKRMIFDHEREGWHIDVLVDVFKMCHLIHFSQERLTVESQTVPLAELLLSKLQVVQLNEKDVKDLAALLLEHPISAGDVETVNTDRITRLTADDWGFFTSTRENIDRIPGIILGMGLTPSQNVCVTDRAGELGRVLDAAPKTLRWKLRSLVGKRMPWHEEPEEAARGAIPMTPG